MTLGGTWEVLTECPWCGAANNGHTRTSHSDGGPPDTGSVTVCAYCGGIAIFVSSSELRRPTREEFDDLRRDPSVRIALSIVRGVRMRRAAGTN